MKKFCFGVGWVAWQCFHVPLSQDVLVIFASQSGAQCYSFILFFFVFQRSRTMKVAIVLVSHPKQFIPLEKKLNSTAFWPKFVATVSYSAKLIGISILWTQIFLHDIFKPEVNLSNVSKFSVLLALWIFFPQAILCAHGWTRPSPLASSDKESEAAQAAWFANLYQEVSSTTAPPSGQEEESDYSGYIWLGGRLVPFPSAYYNGLACCGPYGKWCYPPYQNVQYCSLSINTSYGYIHCPNSVS